MSTAPNALAAIIAYQDQFGAGKMPDPGSPASTAVWSGDSFNFAAGTPIADTSFQPAPGSANIPFQNSGGGGPTVTNTTYAAASNQATTTMHQAPTTYSPGLTPGWSIPTGIPYAKNASTPPPGTTCPGNQLWFEPPYVSFPQCITPTIDPSQWVLSYPQTMVEGGSTTPTVSTCAPSLKFTGVTGRVFCAQTDISGSPTLPLDEWTDVYGTTATETENIYNYLGYGSSATAGSGIVSLANFLKAYSAAKGTTVVNPTPGSQQQQQQQTQNGSKTGGGGGGGGGGGSQQAQPALDFSWGGSLFGGIPNQVLYIGAGAVVLLLVMKK